MRIHLDTDLGSDTDDLCALAMLLGWPDVDLVGITTAIDPGGQRVGFVEHALGMARRRGIPVAAGAEGSLGEFITPVVIPGYWPEPIPARPSPPGAALDLLAASAESGATVVAIGPYTNLAMLEAARPGLLGSTRVVVMGGHVPPMPDGLPPCGRDEDFNVQQDAVAARIVFERCHPVVVGLAPTFRVHLRRRDLDALRGGGPLARLLAEQAERHARDNGREELGRAWPGLPDDLLNFQYDPLACAVAAGWDGVRLEQLPVGLHQAGSLLEMRIEDGGRAMQVVTDVDAERFHRDWLEAVLRASGG